MVLVSFLLPYLPRVRTLAHGRCAQFGNLTSVFRNASQGCPWISLTFPIVTSEPTYCRRKKILESSILRFMVFRRKNYIVCLVLRVDSVVFFFLMVFAFLANGHVRVSTSSEGKQSNSHH